MSQNHLIFLDWFFTIFHLAFSIFNLFGWIFRKTRRLNLYLLLITAFSWFVLGIKYGFGYCPLTDLHWKVLHHLKVYDLPYSYVKFVIDRFFGTNLNDRVVDNVVVGLFFLALGFSLYFNIKDFNRKRKEKHLKSKQDCL
ncbi:MAG: hypothetical protein BWY70_00395 [Bacteroidetes bacterium ADurb.Bin408]|nr:MAG: hypothetical protein BWY70_00395 [Bacteroidetes bacterium ADurb.Bin408]